MTKTTVYFIGGPLGGTKQDMPEPLPSVYTYLEAPAPVSIHQPGKAHEAFNGIEKQHLYIMHTIRSRGGVDSRCLVHNEMELGGISKEDVAHLPR